ncbi:hypothetical protein X975_05763, partial [Stegodyphus mimosarum]
MKWRILPLLEANKKNCPKLPGTSNHHIIALPESFWMLNRGSSVKRTCFHFSGVQLRCSRAQFSGALTYDVEKLKQ